jgi:K+-sensing histidine kinase KdpD
VFGADADRLRLDRYVATVAHDVRNPVTVVRVSAQMAMRQARRGDTEALLRQLAGIVYQSDRLSDMLEGFTEAARIASGSLVLRRQQVALGEVVEQARGRSLRLLGELVQRDVITEGDADVGGAWDRERVVRASKALLDNALLYGDISQPVRVRMARRRRLAMLSFDGGGRGPGATEASRLFECFFRGRAAAEAGYTGTGLGLYTARGIARAHGGDVRHQGGDLFTLELPAG